jgi:protein gp37
MAESSSISWTDATFNPLIGCTKVSEGCKFCYAERDFDHRRHVTKWGPNGSRVLTSDDYWNKPVVWDKRTRHDLVTVDNIKVAMQRGVKTTRDTFLAGAGKDVESSLNRCIEKGFVIEREGFLQPGRPYQRPRVFCASLADVFEDWRGPILSSKGNQIWHSPVGWVSAGPGEPIGGVDGPVTMDDVRCRLFDLIDATLNLDWLLLTKRPENIRRMWVPKKHYRDQYQDDPYPNADAVQGVAGPAYYRQNVWIGTSIENQEMANKRVGHLLRCRDLSPVLFLSAEPLLGPIDLVQAHMTQDALPGFPNAIRVDWVITGGESGPFARPIHPAWFRSIRDQCESAGVAYHHKQNGEFVYEPAPWSSFADGTPTEWDTHEPMTFRWVGVKKAGRELDGVIHDAMPLVSLEERKLND